MALHQSKAGTVDEHWSMQFHPQTSHASATWHSVDAASDKGSGGVLQTDHRIHGGKNGGGYDASKQGKNHMILGSFKSAGHAKAAAESLKGIHCEHPFPAENCVDWTKKAVQKLHDDKHITTERKDAFMAHYNKHAETVRAKTGTADNKKHSK